jgi:hypothetical protein
LLQGDWIPVGIGLQNTVLFAVYFSDKLKVVAKEFDKHPVEFTGENSTKECHRILQSMTWKERSSHLPQYEYITLGINSNALKV